MADRSPHQLPEHENKRIYKDRIEPVLIDAVQARRHESPRLIMLGGQPGSGKTFLLRNRAEEELAREGGAISIDADELRTYHPAAESLKGADDRTAAMHTHPDAAAWVGQAMDTAIGERCHVVLDGTMGSPKSVTERLKRFEDADYTVEVRILAINRRRSWLNVLRRYEDEKSRRGAGRMTPRDVHDEAYEGLLESLEELVQHSRVRLRIYDREKEIFDSDRNSNRPEALQFFQTERDRPWTETEKAAYRDAIEQLVTQARARGADADTIDEYQRLTFQG